MGRTGDDVWALVHAERQALISDLEHLDDESWERPSLCRGWTVHDVAAHLVDNATTTRLGFVASLVRARLDYDEQNARGLVRERGATHRETLARLRQVAARTSTPPATLDSRLVEEVVHGEDVRRVLGLRRAYPDEAVARALALQVRTPKAFGGAKEHVADLELRASDAEVSMGQGSTVSGPMLSLLLAVSGRRVALQDLEGPGVAVLQRST